jgi:hypothetical protein
MAIKKMTDVLHDCFILISCIIEFRVRHVHKIQERIITKISHVEKITLIPDEENPLYGDGK